MFVAFRFRYVNQLNTAGNIYTTIVQSTEKILTYTSKWRKVFWASLSLRRRISRELRAMSRLRPIRSPLSVVRCPFVMLL